MSLPTSSSRSLAVSPGVQGRHMFQPSYLHEHSGLSRASSRHLKR